MKRVRWLSSFLEVVSGWARQLGVMRFSSSAVAKGTPTPTDANAAVGLGRLPDRPRVHQSHLPGTPRERTSFFSATHQYLWTSRFRYECFVLLSSGPQAGTYKGKQATAYRGNIEAPSLSTNFALTRQQKGSDSRHPPDRDQEPRLQQNDRSFREPYSWELHATGLDNLSAPKQPRERAPHILSQTSFAFLLLLSRLRYVYFLSSGRWFQCHCSGGHAPCREPEA